MENTNKEMAANEVNWASSQKPSNFILSGKINSKKEAISFWNEAPMFQSTIDFETEVEHINKFVIEKVEIMGPKIKILHGAKQIAIVEGIFAESEFTVGQRVSILPCLCCLNEDKCMNNEFSNINRDKYSINEKSVITFHINDSNNTILIEDDVLTVTSFCTAQECINNPLIKSSIADFSFEYGHSSLAIGIIIHELIQSSFINKRQSFEFLTSEAKRIIKENLILLYSCNISDKEALNEVLKNMKNILKLINNGFSIQAIEHKVYSPFYGLKGSIDCLDSKYVIEIKTGKHMNNQHRSQAILYAILTMEQNLKSKLADYGQFLCDVSVLNETSTLVDRESQKEKAATGIEKLYPLLYYVKPGDFVKIELQHEEIVHLMRIRNDIACNKEISPCSCPENYTCAILNKIKNLDSAHFLRRQFDDLELEANREKKYLKGIKISQIKNRIIYRIKDSPLVGEYCHIYTPTLKYVAIGIVQSCENDQVTIDLCDTIELDKIIMICFDNDNNSLKYMRWSLVQLAYFKFLRKDNLGKGIDSFLLPGQIHGLDVECFSESMSFDDIELGDLDFSSTDCNDKSIPTKSHISTVELARKRNDSSDFEFSSEISLPDAKKLSFNNSGDDSSIESYLLASDCSSLSKSAFANESSLIACDYSNDNDLTSLQLPNASPITQTHFPIESSLLPDNFLSLNSNRSSNSKHNRTPLANINPSFSKLSFEMPKPKVLFNNFDATDSFPYFTPPSKASFPSFKYCIPDIFKNEFLKLNEDQRSALFSSLNCENYRIVHGMPGTGKSTLIALLIKILIFYGQKVLLVCYTHLAIQNVLNKVGSVNYYRAKKQDLNFNSYEETVKCLTKPDLVAGTCYSFNDPIYIKKRFDYCIIDEGSQIHLLLSLIPIHISDRFCMVGDHLQLKPLCKKGKYLSMSLFEHLIDKCSVLTHQYRMGNEIMRLSNTLFYNNQLIGFDGHSSVTFVDSENINFSEYIASLKNITILCYFNVKVREVQGLNKDLIVTTIDRFQGSEADEVLLIFDPVERCSVIESRERLNVGLTRARKKLILLGNRKEMCKIELFNELLEIL